MTVRIAVLGSWEDEARVHALQGRLLEWGFVPVGPIGDPLCRGELMARTQEACGQYRKDTDGLAAVDDPQVCGLDPRHPDPGPGCGDWRPDPVTCPACGRSGAEHARDYARFAPACTAWPPAEA